MIHCQCRTLMCRLDTLTRCRIRWVCDAHDKAMLQGRRLDPLALGLDWFDVAPPIPCDPTPDGVPPTDFDG